MTDELRFRRARPDEVIVLADMTMAGLYHWGYDRDFPELMEEFRQENLPTAEYIAASPVFVMVEGERPVGYFGLLVNEDRAFVDLRYLFLETDYIGRGYGKRLWLAAVDEARKTGLDRMRIVSDPAAVGFYEAMGATWERDLHVQPGFDLGIYWLDLNAGA